MKQNLILSQQHINLSATLGNRCNSLLRQRNERLLERVISSIKHSDAVKRRLPSATGTHRALQPQKVSLGKRLALQVGQIEATPQVTLQKPAVEIITKRKPSGVTIRKRELPHPALTFESQPQIAASCDETLLRNSSKLRLLHSNKRKGFNNVLVLSGEFLLNENNFWQEEAVDQNVSGVYRKLTSVAELVWVVSKERTLAKLKEFCQQNQLPLDAVYLLDGKRKCSLTVNYQPILEQLSPLTHRVMAFDMLRTNEQMPIDDFVAYENKLPLGSFAGLSCYLIKTDKQVSHSQLLGAVLKVFIGSATASAQKLDDILRDYLHFLKHNSNTLVERKRRKASDKPITTKRLPQTECGESEDEEGRHDKTLQHIERLKREWVPEIVGQNKSKSTSTGESIHYIVGDLLKRNFELLRTFAKNKQDKTPKYTSERPNTTNAAVRRAFPNDFFVQRLEYSVPVHVVCAF